MIGIELKLFCIYMIVGFEVYNSMFTDFSRSVHTLFKLIQYTLIHSNKNLF